MPESVSIRSFVCRFSRGILGRMRNMIEARRNQSEINHVTGDVFYLTLALSRRRTVLTVHDCGSIKFRKGLRRELVRLLWFELPTRWATAVTTVSETTRDEVLRLTSCPPSKITVVPNPLPPGFDPDFKPFSGGHPQLLQVGTVDCKNVENVIRALSGLPCRLPSSASCRRHRRISSRNTGSITGTSSDSLIPRSSKSIEDATLSCFAQFMKGSECRSLRRMQWEDR